MCCVFILLYVRDYCYIGQDDSAASSVLYDRLLLKWKTFMFLQTGCSRSMAWAFQKEFTAPKAKVPWVVDAVANDRLIWHTKICILITCFII